MKEKYIPENKDDLSIGGCEHLADTAITLCNDKTRATVAFYVPFWLFLLGVAEDDGCTINPTDAPRVWTDPQYGITDVRDWPGGYDGNYGQRITEKDASLMADAIEKVVSDLEGNGDPKNESDTDEPRGSSFITDVMKDCIRTLRGGPVRIYAGESPVQAYFLLQGDTHFCFTVVAWVNSIRLASQYGFSDYQDLLRPADTGCGQGKVITSDMANAMADAIERAMEDISEFDTHAAYIPVIDRFVPSEDDVIIDHINRDYKRLMLRSILGDERRIWVPDYTLEPTEFYSGGMKKRLQQFIDFCRQGEFTLRQGSHRTPVWDMLGLYDPEGNCTIEP